MGGASRHTRARLAGVPTPAVPRRAFRHMLTGRDNFACQGNLAGQDKVTGEL